MQKVAREWAKLVSRVHFPNCSATKRALHSFQFRLYPGNPRERPSPDNRASNPAAAAAPQRKRKRSRSGKIKFKSKTKKGFEAELLLRFKPDKYRHMATLKADAAEAIQVPEPVVVKRVRFDDRAIGVKVAHKGEWRASPVDGDRERGEAGADATRTLAMMMLSLYQVLQLSKAIDKDAASGAGK